MLHTAISAHKLIDFKTFLSTTDEQWLSNLRDKSKATAQYNQAWAMTQFLIYSRDARGNALYEDNLLEMLRLIHHGCEGKSAFEQAFSSNYSGFERVFTEWAHSISPTAQASFTEQQNVLADLMVELYGNGKRFDNLDEFRSYLVGGAFHVQPSPGSAETLAADYFCGPGGEPLSPDRLFFADRLGAPTPDMIYRPGNGIEIRTRFQQDADALSYETTLQTW